MTRWMRPMAAVAVLCLFVGACGDDDDGDAAPEETSETTAADAGIEEFTVSDDNKFQPAAMAVPVGTTVKFVFKNTGKQPHEAVFGDQQFQDDHEKEMTEQAEHGDEPHGAEHKSEDFVGIEPGQTEEFEYTFDEKGTFFIACHVQPDHYEKGEKVTVTVT